MVEADFQTGAEQHILHLAADVQVLDNRLYTLALTGSIPKFNTAGAAKRGTGFQFVVKIAADGLVVVHFGKVLDEIISFSGLKLLHSQNIEKL
jgi:hypothetical protein